ncbi:MAG: DMT family transporter [Burkholderiales bacterium]|nr:DMT family transporter [Burkholderiales bacterium]
MDDGNTGPRQSFATLRALVTRFEQAPGPTRAIIWAISAGLLFSALNMMVRRLTLELHPFQTQFLRHLFGLIVMLPLILRAGWRAYRPVSARGHFSRGAVHTVGISLWFIALPHLALADTTAIGYTGPIFTMILAAWLLGETMRWDRWLAAALGFAGVMIVVGPRLAGSGGWYSLIMLASAPIFSLSFLLTKLLTRHDSPAVIVVWQGIAVSTLSLPLALWFWSWPTTAQWITFALAGVLGSAGHFCLTHSLKAADMSATQSAKFLDLIWATAWGFLIFGDQPSSATLAGGLVIIGATVWIARRESRRIRQAAASAG